MKSKKQQVEERIPILNRHGDPANVMDGLYEIAAAVDGAARTTNTRASVIVRAINAQTEAIDEMTDVLRATNEILIQRHVYDKAGKDLARVREQVEAARKTLLRQGKKA